MLKKFPLMGFKSQSETYRAAHVSQRLLGPLHSALLHTDGERSHDMTAELHRDPTALQQRTGNNSAMKNSKK